MSGERDSKRYQGSYQEHREEKAQRRGTGFIGFLSDLDWLRSMELEEGRPLDETKITTSEKLFVFSKGFGFGLGIHSSALFLLNPAIFSLFYSMKIESGWGILLIHALSFILPLMVKILFPLWLLSEYYIFPKGVTFVYIQWFIYGYTTGIIIPDTVMLGGILFFMFVYQFIIPYLSQYEIVLRITEIINKYFSIYTDFKWLPVHFLFFLLSFSPLYLMKRWKKKHPIKSYEWMPLDFIPKDE